MDVITIGDAMIAMYPEAKGPIIFCDTFKRKVVEQNLLQLDVQHWD